MKKCKHCKTPFEPLRPLQAVCGLGCAVAIKKTKEVAKLKKERLNDLQGKGYYIKILQMLVNKIVRELDKNKPCISCDKIEAKWDAGHFYPVSTHGSIRFNLNNIYKQCSRCNNELGGNLYEYSKRLKEINCLEIIEEHKAKYNGIKFTIPELKEAIEQAKKALKNLTDRETINNQLNLYK